MAIGDIHGDFDDFVLILQRVGLTDAQQHWTGGAATLVQVGDLLDRGPKEREVLDLLMALEADAGNKGGKVVVLLGNHEVMNIVGDLRYVTPVEYASFSDASSEKRRQSAYKEYVAWYKQHSALLAEAPAGVLRPPDEAAWMRSHPLGYFEQRQALAADGRYGAWIRKRPAIVKIDDSIFLHGGIDSRFSSMSLDAINAQIEEELRSFDSAKQALTEAGVILPFFTLEEITAAATGQLKAARKSAAPDQRQARHLETILGIGSWLCVVADGPLWFRGYAHWQEEEGAAVVPGLLQRYEAAHFVVGHTPQPTGRITPRFQGKVFLIDTGMLRSSYPFGRASALKIEGQTRFLAEYTDSEELLFPAPVSSRPEAPADSGSSSPFSVRADSPGASRRLVR